VSEGICGLRTFKQGTNFAGWLFRIAHNNFANYHRGLRRPEALLDDHAAEESGPLEQLRPTSRWKNWAGLATTAAGFSGRDAFAAEEGMSFREIAEVLGLTEETARWRVFKARQKLMNLLARGWSTRNHELRSTATLSARSRLPK